MSNTSDGVTQGDQVYLVWVRATGWAQPKEATLDLLVGLPPENPYLQYSLEGFAAEYELKQSGCESAPETPSRDLVPE